MHRARNWETGLNAAAILYYLTGFEPDAYLRKFNLKPHLPFGWSGFKVEHMPIGQSRIDLEVTAAQEAITYNVANRGSESIHMSARFTLPQSWTDASMDCNLRLVESAIELSRYSVRVLPLEVDIPPGGAVNVELLQKKV